MRIACSLFSRVLLDQIWFASKQTRNILQAVFGASFYTQNAYSVIQILYWHETLNSHTPFSTISTFHLRSYIPLAVWTSFYQFLLVSTLSVPSIPRTIRI